MASVVARTLMVVGAAAALAAGSAHASDVHWSVGIQAPIAPGVSVGTVISNRHGLPVVAPVLVAPPPVYCRHPWWLRRRFMRHRSMRRASCMALRCGSVAAGCVTRCITIRIPVCGVPGSITASAPVPVRRPGREIRY